MATTNYGMDFDQIIDQDYLLPKCVAVWEVGLDGILKSWIRIPSDNKALFDSTKKRIDNDDPFITNEVFHHATDKNYLCNFIQLRQARASSLYQDMIVGYAPILEITSEFHSLLGVANEGQSPQDIIQNWRRYAFAYKIIGDGPASCELSFGDDLGMNLFVSFIHGMRANTKVRIYVFDMSSLRLGYFGISSMAAHSNYGVVIPKYEGKPEHLGMYDTIRNQDYQNGNVEAFNSNAYYMKVRGTVDLKNHFFELPDISHPHPYGKVSGRFVEEGGYIEYSNIQFDISKSALMVGAFVHEYSEMYPWRYGTRENYLPSYYVYPFHRQGNSLRVSSLSIESGQLGPIIQQMPQQLLFLDVEEIDNLIEG